MDYQLLLGMRKQKAPKTPRALLERAVAYFQWAYDNPLQDEQLFSYQGEVIRAPQDKVRALTKRGLAIHLGLTVQRLESYRSSSTNNEDWNDVLDYLEQVIYQQKFEHAAAGLLNANIISRELGLAERSELTGRDGGPLQTEDVTNDANAFAGRMARLAASAAAERDAESVGGSKGSP